jgi:type IV pilus assembly protein PilB
LITATLEAVLAQRLVRRICARCKEEVVPTPDILADLELKASDIAGRKFYRGKGCDACNRSGYRGRVGLFELMTFNDDMRDMVMRNASTDELRTAARGVGMVTLRDAGIQSIFEGTTTAEEVIRETIIEA